MTASLPAYMPVDNDDGAKCGVGFVVKTPAGSPWLVVPAHMGNSEPTSVAVPSNLAAWNRTLFVITAPGKVARISLFRDRGEPIFKRVGEDCLSDIVVIPLSYSDLEPGGLFAGVETIDLPPDSDANCAGTALVLDGYPSRGDVWPYDPPIRAGGTAMSNMIAKWDGDDADCHGFSGSPVFTASGDLYGMYVGAGQGHMLVIPAQHIRMAVLGFPELCPTVSASNMVGYSVPVNA